MAAGENPDGLVCAIVTVATDDVYEGMMPAGAWRQELTTEWLKALDARDVYDEWRANESCGPYWDTGRLTPEERGRIDHPMLLVGGFFDIFSHSQLRMHRDFRNQVAPGSRQDQFLVHGPWTHGGAIFDEGAAVMEGDVHFISSAGYDWFARDIMDFLEWNLNGGERPSWAPVRYFRTRLGDTGLTATGTWRTVDEWPPVGSEVRLYLNPEGVLAVDQAVQTGAAVNIPVNPSDPVPSVCGGNLTTKAGICDQSIIDARPDVAVFQTVPVLQDTSVEGDVSVRIRAVFSSDDGDVVVRLSQVTPTGAAMLLSDGIFRARFLGGFESPAAVVAGQPVDVDVKLGPVAFELPVGHALRIAVSGTSSPRYEVNPGHFVPLSEVAELLPTELGLVAGESYLNITVTGGNSWGAIPDTGEEVQPDSGTSADNAGLSDEASDDDLSDVGLVDVDSGNVDASVSGDTCQADSSVCTCPQSAGCQASGGARSTSGLPALSCMMLALIIIIAARRRRNWSRPTD
jgi:putative CocE/NonD family hydrolase